MRKLFDTPDKLEKKARKPDPEPPVENNENPYITIALLRIMLEEYRHRMACKRTYNTYLSKALKRHNRKITNVRQKVKYFRKEYHKKRLEVWELKRKITGPVTTKEDLLNSDFAIVALFANLYNFKVSRDWLVWLILYQYDTFDRHIMDEWGVVMYRNWFEAKVITGELETEIGHNRKRTYFLSFKKRQEVKKEFEEYLEKWNDHLLNKYQTKLKATFAGSKSRLMALRDSSMNSTSPATSGQTT